MTRNELNELARKLHDMKSDVAESELERAALAAAVEAIAVMAKRAA